MQAVLLIAKCCHYYFDYNHEGLSFPFFVIFPAFDFQEFRTKKWLIFKYGTPKINRSHDDFIGCLVVSVVVACIVRPSSMAATSIFTPTSKSRACGDHRARLNSSHAMATLTQEKSSNSKQNCLT